MILKIFLIFITFCINSLEASDIISYQLVNFDTNQIIQEKNSDIQLQGASIQKILTSIFALETLGEDYQFQTRLNYSGEIENSTLNGDIILIGGGDPYLQFGHLFNLALQIKLKGIKNITGKLLFDDSLLESSTLLEVEGLLDEGYNAGISALSVNFNQTQLWQTKNEMLPFAPLDFINVFPVDLKFPEGLRYSPSKELNSIYNKSHQFSDQWFYSTFKNYQKIERIPVRNASLYTSKLFLFFVQSLGIKIKSEIKKLNETINQKELFIHKSLPIRELIQLNLEYSNNLLSELLLIHSAQQIKKEKCTTEECAKVLQKWAIDFFDLSNKQINLVNGSGLGEGNFVTSTALNKILKKSFYKIVPLLTSSGVNGVIKKTYPARNQFLKIWAKTGNMDYVHSIWGAYLGDKQQVMLFNILINNSELRKKIFSKNIEENFKFRNQAKYWSSKALEQQQQILNGWMKTF